jgi:hypothetical protein
LRAANPVARLQAKFARRRKDALQKATTTIVKNHGVVVIRQITYKARAGVPHKDGRFGTNRSPKITRLHLNAVDVKVGHVDVPGPGSLRRKAARVDTRAAVMEFVAASVR